jgi:hypothetical protein
MFSRLTSPVPVHVMAISTLKDDEDTKSKTSMVVSRVAEVSGPRTWKSGSANSAKPVAPSNTVSVHSLRWEMVTAAWEDALPGSGGVWGFSSLATRNTKVLTHPDGSVEEKKASALPPLRSKTSAASAVPGRTSPTNGTASRAVTKSRFFIGIPPSAGSHGRRR